jgi:hypothetical protein
MHNVKNKRSNAASPGDLADDTILQCKFALESIAREDCTEKIT